MNFIPALEFGQSQEINCNEIWPESENNKRFAGERDKEGVFPAIIISMSSQKLCKEQK